MSTVKEKLGKRIRDLRKKRGYTQARLAEKVGVSDNFIGYVERGAQTPSLDTLSRIAGALDVTIRDLFLFPEDLGRIPYVRSKKEELIDKLANCLRERDEKYISIILNLSKKTAKGK